MSELESWTLKKWLKKLGLHKYKQAFLDNGYDTVDLCADLKKEDLDAVGVTNKHHRSTLFTQSKKLQELIAKESLEEEDGEEEVDAVDTRKEEKTSKLAVKKPPNLSLADTSQLQGTAQDLSDYSEPWNASAPNSQPVPTSPTPKVSTLKPAAGTPSDGVDGLSPGHRSGQPTAGFKVPSGTELPAFKGEKSTGLTRLQLKLKIREVLFSRGVVLSEPQYCKEDGSPNLGKLSDLAIELAAKLGFDSLEMYAVLQQEWSNANEAFIGKKNKVVAGGGKKKPEVRPSPKSPASPKSSFSSVAPTDNYDEPFDSANLAVKKSSPKFSPRKSSTMSMPPPSSDPNGCYDEPFDSVTNGQSPPEKPKKITKIENQSQTLPSPSRARKSAGAEGSPSHSPMTSPLPSPFHKSKQTKFNLFKRREKARSQSVRDSDLKLADLKFLEEGKKSGKKQGLLSFPSKDSPMRAKHISAENVSEMGVQPTSEQLAHLKKGVPPPIPLPRSRKTTGESSTEDSDDSPNLQPTKIHQGYTFRKFITPPTLPRDQKPHFDDSSVSSGSSAGSDTPKRFVKNKGYKGSKSSTLGIIGNDDDEMDGRGWMRASKSFDELHKIHLDEKGSHSSSKKKSKTAKLISIFKRKNWSPTLKRRAMRKSPKDGNRESVVSNVSSTSENRERDLTGSISMPDISNIADSRSSKTLATSPGQDSGYAEVFDAVKPGEMVLTVMKGGQNHIPQKSPRSTPKRSPRNSLGTSPRNSLGTSPQKTSPILTPSSHRQMVIRGTSESSTPDRIIISIKPGSAPDTGFADLEDSTSLDSKHTATSIDSLKSSNSEDPVPQSHSHVVSTVHGMKPSDVSMIRTGSASSNTSEVSVGSLTKKPPTLPKPVLPSSKVKSGPREVSPYKREPPRSSSSTSGATTPSPSSSPPTLRNVTTSPSTPKNVTSSPPTPRSATSSSSQPAKPPPKPARTLPRKTKKDSTFPGTDSTPNTKSSTLPPNVHAITNGDTNPKPPPKPARTSVKRKSQEMKEQVVTCSRDDSVTTPPAADSHGEEAKPPLKPTRRGKSVKIVDPLSEERKGKTLDSKSTKDASPLSSSQDSHTTSTLPHNFRVEGRKGVTSNVGSVSPKPVPKPRPSVDNLTQLIKPPRAN